MKIATKLIAMLICLVSLFNIAWAVPADDSVMLQDTSSALYLDIENKVLQNQAIHATVIDAGFCSLSSTGTFCIDADAASLNFSESQFSSYLESIEKLNDIIELGVVTVSDDFSVHSKSSDEITDIIFERDQMQCLQHTLSDNCFDQTSVTSVFSVNSQISLTSSLPTLYAYSLAYNNWLTLLDYYTTLSTYSPTSAWTNAVAWWVAKVKPGGLWDYKVVSGYSPYNKEWNAVQRYTTSVKTSEWFGNYNYAFTGKILFSLSVLKTGSGAASLASSSRLDTEEDIAAITQGYNEAP